MSSTTLPLAKRLENLGTETAFAVSLDAAAFAAKGNKVYPFHLGDLDMRTPDNIIDAAHQAMLSGKTGYAPAAGIQPLREALAENVGRDRGVEYGPENVAIQPGGKPVIPKFLETVMNPGEAVFYPNPGFPIYESQINYLGGEAIPYGYTYTGDQFIINRDEIESQIRDNARALIYNNYQNPIGAESTDEEMQWLADFAVKYNLWVLSDEAYFKILYSDKGKSIVSLPGMRERTVILYTFSKTYAMTGWRLGGAIGPPEVIAHFAKLNVNIESCTSHCIQYAGMECLQGDQSGAEEILHTLEERRDALFSELQKIEGVDVFKPHSSFYLFPDITTIYERLGSTSLEDFRLRTLEETGVSFCTREHFGTPLPSETRKFVRFAFSGISSENIREGLARLRDYWSSGVSAIAR